MKSTIKRIKFIRKCIVYLKHTLTSLRLKIFGYHVLNRTLKILQISGFEGVLMYGTLLGFVRDSKFPKYDYDIDLAVLISDVTKNHRVKEILYESFKKNKIKTVLKDEYIFIRIFGVRVDIEFYTLVPKISTTVGKTYIRFGSKSKLNALGRFETVPIIGTEAIISKKGEIYMIPKNYTSVLESAYGKNWKIPIKFSYDWDSDYQL